MTPARQQDYMTLARQYNKQLVDAYLALKGMQFEWSAEDVGNNAFNGEGENDGYTSAQVGAVVFDTVGAIDTMMAAGHGTNVANLL